MSLDEIAAEVAAILTRRLSARDILQLCQITFLEVEEVAELLRVKPKTISTWISKNAIPVRYAGGRPVFLLAELLAWTLPEDDPHSRYRISAPSGCKIAVANLTERRLTKE